jgi:hypothetical protein
MLLSIICFDAVNKEMAPNKLHHETVLFTKINADDIRKNMYLRKNSSTRNNASSSPPVVTDLKAWVGRLLVVHFNGRHPQGWIVLLTRYLLHKCSLVLCRL